MNLAQALELGSGAREEARGAATEAACARGTPALRATILRGSSVSAAAVVHYRMANYLGKARLEVMPVINDIHFRSCR